MISAVNGAGKLFMGRMLVFDPLPLILYYSIMQWLKDLNIKPQTLKLLEGNVGKTLKTLE